jgi:hypothetical protein
MVEKREAKLMAVSESLLPDAVPNCHREEGGRRASIEKYTKEMAEDV